MSVSEGSVGASEGWSGLIVRLARMPKYPVNRLGGETSLSEEALLTCTLSGILRDDTKATSPSLKCALALSGTQTSQNRVADLRIESVALQLLLDSPKAETR